MQLLRFRRKTILLKNYILIIRESKWFSYLTSFVILFYSLMLGFKTVEDIENRFSLFFYWLDYSVTIYFFIEITIKILAEKKVFDFFRSGWNIFDFIVVVVTLIPLENASMAAIARLLRIFRILRLITSRPELKKIINMLIGSIPALVDVVLFMFIIFYIYAIIGNFLFESVPSGLWNDFASSMLTLFGIITFDDWQKIMYEAMVIHSWSWIYFISFIIIIAFVFLNLFTAMMIDEMDNLKKQELYQEVESQDNKKLDLILNKISNIENEIQYIKDNNLEKVE